MKKIISSIISVLICITTYAWDFSAQIGGQYNKITWYFDWVDEAHTMCQTAASNEISIEYGQNQYTSSQYEWHIVDKTGQVKQTYELGNLVPNEINWIIRDYGFPTEVEYEGRMIPIVAIGDYSFTGRVGVAVEIPESITKIGKGAFYKANQSITLHDKITYIDDFAFYYNPFPTIELNNLEKLGSYAFGDCTNVESITIKNTKEIGDHAFFGVTSVTSITLENVEIIGDYAFTGLEGEGEHSSSCGRGQATIKLQHLDLGQTITQIGNYAFAECHALQEINIPNSATYIGDYAFYHCIEACPIIFLGSNVEYIGSWAFGGGTYHGCETTHISLPSSIKTIGDHAFTFNNEEGVFTDLYIDATIPPDLVLDDDGCTAFGYYDPSKINNTFFNDPAAWIYSYVCLHVPYGSYAAYANADGWKEFQCIIEDGEVDTTKPLSENIYYAFIVPQEEINLAEEFDMDIDYWDIPNNNNTIELNLSSVKGLTMGQQIILGYRHNRKFNGDSWDELDDELVACAIIFVCPTITLICDNLEEKNIQKAKALSINEDGQEDTETTDYDGLIEDYASYQHRVVYNSYPKFQITAPQGITIIELNKGKFDEDYNFTEEYQDGTLQEIKDDQKVTETTEDNGNYVVPLNPITENRVIKITTYITPEGSLSGVNEVTLSHNITIKTFARTIMIEGAEDTDLVMVYNYKGQMLKQTTDKTIEFGDNGIYIVTVGDVAFKVMIP